MLWQFVSENNSKCLMKIFLHLPKYRQKIRIAELNGNVRVVIGSSLARYL